MQYYELDIHYVERDVYHVIIDNKLVIARPCKFRNNNNLPISSFTHRVSQQGGSYWIIEKSSREMIASTTKFNRMLVSTLQAGSRIHLNSRQGIYTLITVLKNKLVVKTNRYVLEVPHDDYKCLAGGINLWAR